MSYSAALDWISGHWAEAAMAVSLAGWIALTFGNRRKYWIGSMLLVLVSSKIFPIGQAHLSLAAILAGACGEISSLSVLLVIANFLPRWTTLRVRKLLILPVIAGLVLYWSVLTYGPVDLYRLGYLHASSGKLGSLILLSAVAMLSLIMPIRLVSLLALACISWSLGLQASSNLWDYLLDVPSILIYLGLLTQNYIRRPNNDPPQKPSL